MKSVILSLVALVALFAYASALSFPKLVGRRWAVGGLFNTAYQTDSTTLEVGNFAAWNGTTWMSYDGGVNDEVKVVAVDTCRNLYIGGDFDKTRAATPVETGPLAVWYRDSTAWEKIGTYNSFTGSVYSISVDCFNIPDIKTKACNCDVYIAGNFAMNITGTTVAINVAKYDANTDTWSNLGGDSEHKISDSANVIYKRDVPTSITAEATRIVHVAGKGFYKQYNTKDKKWTDKTPSGFGLGKFEAMEYQPQYFSTDKIFFSGDFDFPISSAVDAPRCVNVCEYNRKTDAWIRIVTSDTAYPDGSVRDLKLVGSTLYLVGEFNNTGTPYIAKISADGSTALQAATTSDSTAITEELRSIDVCSKTDVSCKAGSITVGSKNGLLKFYNSDDQTWINFGDSSVSLKDVGLTTSNGRLNSVLTWNYLGAASSSTVFSISSAFVMLIALVVMML